MSEHDPDPSDLRDDPHDVDALGDVPATAPAAPPQDAGAPGLVEPATAGGHGDWRADPAVAADPELAAWLEAAPDDAGPADETGARLAEALGDDAEHNAPPVDELVRRTLSQRD